MSQTQANERGNSDLARISDNPSLLFSRNIDQAFNRLWRYFNDDTFSPFTDIAPWPALDLSEDENAVTVRIDTPGIEAKDIEVRVFGSTVEISGHREEESDERKKGYRHHERRTGSFTRSITLPAYANLEKAEAKCEKGVLTLTVPKMADASPRKLQVKSS